MSKTKRIIRIFILIITLLAIITTIFANNSPFKNEFKASSLDSDLPEGTNGSYFCNWVKSYSKKGSDNKEFTIADLGLSPNVSREDAYGYSQDVLMLSQNDTITFDLNVSDSGLYTLSFDYYSLTENILPIKYQLKVNDSYQYSELSQLTLNTYWMYDEFTKDRYGNELGLNQTQIKEWRVGKLNDTSGLNDEKLEIYLEQGNNTISIKVTQGKFLLGKVHLYSLNELNGYNEYLNSHSNVSSPKKVYEIEAEHLSFKNDAGIQVASTNNINASPSIMIHDEINVISGSSFDELGQELTYKVEVEESGLYKLAIKVLQNEYRNKNGYVYVKVNGEIPFTEASNIPVEFSSEFKNNLLGGYLYYLEKGVNEISIGLTGANIRYIYLRIKDIALEVNDLGLDIIELTGNNSDKDRDWILEEYIPNVTSLLKGWKEELTGFEKELHTINNTNKHSQETQYISNAIENIDKILKDVNKLPYRLSLLNKDSGSITYFLSSVIETMPLTPLTIDKLYVYGNDAKIPNAKRNIFFRFFRSFARTIAGLFTNKYEDKSKDEEVTVWVERPRQYVDVMQMMSDSIFTKNTGIKVKFSVLSDESKLLLANSSNQQPDLAMNINAFLPYQYAIRGALKNLREFSDYKEVFGNFYYESYVQYIYEDGIYAMPETQNFQVMYYRKDIFESLEIPVPKTWDEVINILPELQRYGMNFYTPLSQNTSFKIFNATLPYLLQRDVHIYTENGLSPNLDTIEAAEAITFMCDLFNIYSMPTEVGSFYNEFRNSSLPIGIGDFNTYIQLSCAAPEISGLWGIEVFPGTKDSNGNINYSTPGLSQPIIMFNKSTMQNEAWTWMKWWMSTETQLEYEKLLTTSYGEEYMWNSANLNALSNSLIPVEAKEVIIKQINNLKNIEMVPGYYMMERELSNIWNVAALGGGSVRDAIDDAMISITREMNRKNIEFGYMDNSYQVIRTAQTDVRSLLKEWGLIEDED